MPMTLRLSLQFALALVASGFAVSQAPPQAKAQEAGAAVGTPLDRSA